MGEPAFDYIRKRRITEIAYKLIKTRQPIVDLALAYGYESQQSMTKAFRKQYGTTPGRYRRQGKQLFFYERRPMTAGRIQQLASHLSLPSAVVTLPALRIMGLRERLPIAEPDPVENIRARFRTVASALEGQKRHRGFFEVSIMPSEERAGFTREDEFDGLIGYSMRPTAAEPAVESTNDWAEIMLPAQSYLTFRYYGDNTIDTLSRLYGHIFSTGLLNRRESLASDSFFHYYASGQVPGGRERADIRFFLPITGT